jgi:hypothetical protein
MFSKSAQLLAITAACSMATIVNADPLQITNIDGSWVNATPSGNITYLNNQIGSATDSVRWGGSLDSGSGYDFNPNADLLSVTLDSPFALGVFTHINQPITSGSSITNIDYNFGFETNGSPLNLATTFQFGHNETPNITGQSPVDDDLVTIGAISFNQLITVGLDSYYFNLLGFSLDNGVTFSNIFSSPEMGSNSATLYGTVTAQPLPPNFERDENPVSEPPVGLLLMTGLIGLLGFRRRA